MARPIAPRELWWSAPFECPEEYIKRHVDLAHAGNVHVAEGRTVDTGHLVADETTGRESFYVGMSRSRERNAAYVATDRTHAAELSPEPRPAQPSQTSVQRRMIDHRGTV